MNNLYEEREIDDLDTYIDHVIAMTTEGLRSKVAIAAELAFRDSQIDFLQDSVGESVTNTIVKFGAWIVDNHESEINGGEDQIMKLCSDFLERHDEKLCNDDLPLVDISEINTY